MTSLAVKRYFQSVEYNLESQPDRGFRAAYLRGELERWLAYDGREFGACEVLSIMIFLDELLETLRASARADIAAAKRRMSA